VALGKSEIFILRARPGIAPFTRSPAHPGRNSRTIARACSKDCRPSSTPTVWRVGYVKLRHLARGSRSRGWVVSDEARPSVRPIFGPVSLAYGSELKARFGKPRRVGPHDAIFLQIAHFADGPSLCHPTRIWRPSPDTRART
jgi:hypothetical protein